MPALCLAVRDRLRTALGYTIKDCKFGWDGRPEPRSGETFVAVHPGSISNNASTHLAEMHSFSVTISVRLGRQPVDRWGEETVAKATTGLYAKADAIKAKLHMDPGGVVRTAANAIIGGSANGFSEDIVYLGMGPPVERGPDWWWAEAESNPPSGLSLTLEFGEAGRYQSIESMT